MNKLWNIINQGCAVVLLLGGTTSFLILIAVIGLFRSCMGYDEIDIDNDIMKRRHMFDQAYITDSLGNGYELQWWTKDAVSDKRWKEMLTRYHVYKSYQKLEEEAPARFNHDLINTDIYEFTQYAKQFDIDPDIRLATVFVYGLEYKKLYWRPNPAYPELKLSPLDDIGILYIGEFDVYPYNFEAPQRYRYWKCFATSLTDERYSHITEIEYQRRND